MLRTANPVLSDKALHSSRSAVVGETMTIEGAVNRSVISVVLTMAAGYWSYSTPSLASMSLIFVIAGLILALVISFKHSLAPMLTPAYAVVEGLFLGSLSLFADSQFPGIAFQAISLTFGVLFTMLIAYRSGFIKMTDKLRSGIVIATGAIFVIYLVTFVAGLFGANIAFLHSNSPLSIGFSFLVVGLAAMNLLLDFDLIERLAQQGNQPKHMEWYGAFALLVTLVWLYLEMLRLLMKLQSRD